MEKPFKPSQKTLVIKRKKKEKMERWTSKEIKKRFNVRFLGSHFFMLPFMEYTKPSFAQNMEINMKRLCDSYDNLIVEWFISRGSQAAYIHTKGMQSARREKRKAYAKINLENVDWFLLHCLRDRNIINWRHPTDRSAFGKFRLVFPSSYEAINFCHQVRVLQESTDYNMYKVEGINYE